MVSKIIDKARESISSAKDKMGDFKDILMDDDKKEIVEQFKDTSKGCSFIQTGRTGHLLSIILL